MPHMCLWGNGSALSGDRIIRIIREMREICFQVSVSEEVKHENWKKENEDPEELLKSWTT